VLYRQSTAENGDKVVLVSGGGSGHEPAHAGYLGEGALDVVVAGEIFASPSASQILAGLKTVKSSKGTLLIVKNYTGDKLNFGLAAEKAKAVHQNVNMVIVGEDVSVEGNSLVGQRGLAGVVFVHKIAGAKAAKGASLDEVTAVATKAASQMATVAASLDRCSVPGRSQQESLPHDQLEYGMGIHNEPGVKRETISSLETTVQKSLDIMFRPKTNMWQPQGGQRVALMVNNLGGLSVLELGVIADEVVRQLGERQIHIDRSLVGTFVTSLDGPGFSISLLQLDDELTHLLDEPTTAPAWPRSIHGWATSAEMVSKRGTEGLTEELDDIEIGVKVPTSLIKAILDSVQKTTTEDEPKITAYDTLAGDGDCGETLLNGINGLVKEFQNDETETLDIGLFFRRTASTAERSMGGTSGALYAIFLNAVANRLTQLTSASPSQAVIVDLLRDSLRGGLDELCRYTPARTGHRTLMDALIPFVQAFGQRGEGDGAGSQSTLESAVAEARKGADSTRRMVAALGRASYVGQERFDEEGGIPDPGALGVVSILRGVEEALKLPRVSDGHLTRTGCLNCRRKKRKCDEGRPTCGTCYRRDEHCEWGLKITFRAENAQGLDERHPSMRKMAKKRPPKEFEILDVTQDVISDYHVASPVMESDEDDTVDPESRNNGRNVVRPNLNQNARQDTGPFFARQQRSSVIPNASPASRRQTESAVANLLYLSQSGQANLHAHIHAQPHVQPHVDIDPALQQVTMDPISLEMMNEYSYMEQMQAFTPEGSSEDGIFLPGSAYHELHSTLRNHLIQETRSNAPTRSTTPRYDIHSHNGHDVSVIRDEFVESVTVPDFQTLAIPVSAPTLLSEENECALWKNYFDEIAPWLDKFDRDRHFQYTLPTMAKDHGHLRYSMLALSARQLELKETTLPTDRSLALYQEAIHLLLPDLPTRSTAVIATCVILCVLEMLSCSPKAWQRHLDGCASLMEAVGINGTVGGTDQALFWCFARMDVCGGLISSVKTLIPISHWASKQTLDADVEHFKSTKDFEQWANYAVYLIAQVLALLAPLPSETLQAPTRNDPKFRARWLKLWKYICDWHHQRPAPLLPTMTIPSSSSSPFPTILFSNPAAISGNQLHHTASILMLQNQPPAVRLAPKPRSILWHARQVCGISISNDHHGAWTNGIQPLWIAGRCMSHPSEHKAILELLERIERESGWGTRWRAEDLKEFWGDLGD
ncbi:Dak1 domain-containing protein, partial [Mariannaea sp. PMI_226]